ncbi:deoxyribose-phosphate aldolase [candidate division KSB1 bacterium]|nr:deoxyribose-phosphate aldolase [candidate division KSB1 bacterium]
MTLESRIAEKLSAADRFVPPNPPHSIANRSVEELAAAIDHTALRPNTTQNEIEKLCKEAQLYHFAAVCVNPVWVQLCRSLLGDDNSAVCSVVGFPLGANGEAIKAAETRWVVDQGADEVDMVINIGALLNSNHEIVAREIKAVVAAAGSRPVKVILETCLLQRKDIIAGCVIAREAGAQFVKTSTGFSTSGATLADVQLMRWAVSSDFGVKASGGIRDLLAALTLLAAGADRLGTSSGVSIIKEASESFADSVNTESES